MLLDLIRTAVHDQLVPGIRTGCVLSGGIDSSTVTMLAREQGERPVFTGFYRGDRYDERKWARLVGGPDHHEIEITPQDFIDHIDDVIEAVGGAQVGPGAFGQYMVARYASRYVDRVLSGEGGDELFGGYARLAIVAGAAGQFGLLLFQLFFQLFDAIQYLLDFFHRSVTAALKQACNLGQMGFGFVDPRQRALASLANRRRAFAREQIHAAQNASHPRSPSCASGLGMNGRSS